MQHNSMMSGNSEHSPFHRATYIILLCANSGIRLYLCNIRNCASEEETNLAVAVKNAHMLSFSFIIHCFLWRRSAMIK